jgi:hypothetical protein
VLTSKKVLIYEIVGTAFIIFLGSAFHFTYEFSGRFAFVGVFSAVNESVWEHLKLAFWPSVIWLLIEYLPVKKLTNNFYSCSCGRANRELYSFHEKTVFKKYRQDCTRYINCLRNCFHSFHFLRAAFTYFPGSRKWRIRNSNIAQNMTIKFKMSEALSKTCQIILYVLW